MDKWLRVFLRNQGLVVGYYQPGGVPVVRYSRSAHSVATPPSATAVHESAHQALTVASAHGAFSTELAQFVNFLEKTRPDLSGNMSITALQQEVRGCFEHLVESSILTQEAFATHNEIQYLRAHQGALAAAALRQSLPEIYAHAIEILEKILSTLPTKLEQFEEGLLSGVAGGLAGAALNTEIFEYFEDVADINRNRIAEFLAHPENNPDERLLLLRECAVANSRLLSPLRQILNEASDAFWTKVSPHSESIYEDFLKLNWNLGEVVDMAVQEFVQRLGLFPVTNWIHRDLKTQNLRRDAIGQGLMRKFGIVPSRRHRPGLKELNASTLSETQSFEILDDRQRAATVSNLDDFAEWLTAEGALPSPSQSRLAFSVAPIGMPHGGTSQWGSVIASLTVSPGVVRFNRSGVEFMGFTPSQMAEALRRLEPWPSSIVILPEIRAAVPKEDWETVIGQTNLPVFEYLRTVSVERISKALANYGGSVRARVLPDFLEANSVFSIQDNSNKLRLLWFATDSFANLFRHLLRRRGVQLIDAPSNMANDKELALILAAWTCTYGTIGALEP